MLPKQEMASKGNSNKTLNQTLSTTCRPTYYKVRSKDPRINLPYYLQGVKSTQDKLSIQGRKGCYIGPELVVWQLGWVDLDLKCSTILLGQ